MVQKGASGHHKAWSAESALESGAIAGLTLLSEGLNNAVVTGQTLDREDLLTLCLNSENHAGKDCFAIHDDGASATSSLVTWDL